MCTNKWQARGSTLLGKRNSIYTKINKKHYKVYIIVETKNIEMIYDNPQWIIILRCYKWFSV